MKLIQYSRFSYYLVLMALPLIMAGCSGTDGDDARLPAFTTTITDTMLLPYTAHVYNNQLSKGYYFLFTYKMNKNAPMKKGWQQIIDGNGQTVFFRKTERGSDFKLHPNGLMSYFGTHKVFLMDSTFRTIDSVDCVNGVVTDVHDFLILPNGNYLLIGTESFDMDLSDYKIFMRKDLHGSKNAKVKYGMIQEFDRNKKLVYEWHAKPYFRMEDAEKVYLNDTVNMDITHFNSIDVDKAGNFIISARYSNEIIKVQKSDGKVLWRLGGKNNQFTFIGDNTPFLGQHDARLLENGHLLLFDNGYGAEEVQHNARALEYELDEKQKTAKLVWSYEYEQKIVSEATGNARRTANGTTLVNFGKIKNSIPNITLVMVDEKKEKAFDLIFADTIGTYRAYHYPTLPFQLKRPEVKLTAEKDGWLLEAEKGHAAYHWSTGETTQSIRVKTPGKYYVFVPCGDDGFVSSETVVVTK